MSFTKALSFPGLEHVLHGVQEKVTVKMKHFSGWLLQAKEVAALFACRMYVDLIINAFLSSPAMTWIRERLLAGRIRTPYEKRFVFIDDFLADILLLNYLQKIYKPDQITNPKQDQDQETFIDIRKAGEAIVSRFWLLYGLMLQSLSAALHEIRMFGRSCPCHPMSALAGPGEAGKLTTYYLRRKQLETEAWMCQPCLLKGCACDQLACGKGDQIMNASLEGWKGILLQELTGITDADRGDILNDFQLGSEMTIYLCSFKLSIFQIVPWKFIGLANHDETEARTCAGQIISQWKSTSHRRHHELTLEYCDENGQFRQELQAVAAGRPRKDCAVLHAECDWLGLCRANEVSAERLHRTGTLKTTHAPMRSAVFLSYGLRGNELVDTVYERDDLVEFAECCREVKTQDGVVQCFRLQQHPALAKERDIAIAKGIKIKAVMAPYKVIRQVFYRGDLETSFDTYPELAGLIKKNSEELKRSVDLNNINQERSLPQTRSRRSLSP